MRQVLVATLLRDEAATAGRGVKDRMLTIFSTPKPFRGHIGVIQRNAIGSWTHLSGKPQIILFGDSEGTREAAAEFGVEHVPEVESSEFGTPYLRAMITAAEQRARHDLMVFVNGDILLTEGFEKAVRHVSARRKFLMVSTRMNLDLKAPITFDAHWRDWLRRQWAARGAPGDHTGIDLFVFRRGFYEEIPPLVIGRAWVDQWLIKAALERGDVIDASAFVPIVHQNHDYGHIAGGQDSAYRGVEAQQNLAICGGEHAYTLLDCTHELRLDGTLHRAWLRRLRFQARQAAWDVFVRRTVHLREKLKLRRGFWRAKGKPPVGNATS